MLHRRSLFFLLGIAVLALYADAQTPLQDQFFDSKGVRIRYVDVGRGEPIVLIHGFSSSIENNWIEPGVFGKLSKDFRVIALDCRGHGKSDKPHEVSAYGNNMTDDVERLLDHLNIRKAHIVGYSMGGAITGKFITTYEDRVITATFGGSAARRSWTAQNERDTDELASSLEQGKGMRPLILRLVPPNEPKPSDEEIEQRSRQVMARNDAQALAAVVRGNREQTVTDAELKKLRIPLLAVVGSADPIKAGVDAFRAALPAVHVIVIEGATHSGARGATRRPEFAAAVHDFIAAHRATTSQ